MTTQNKPRMRQLRNGHWRCTGKGVKGQGGSAPLAYLRWLQQMTYVEGRTVGNVTEVHQVPRKTITADNVRYFWRPPAYPLLDRVLGGD